MAENLFLLVCADGTKLENPRIEGLSVKFEGGFGATVIIHEGAVFHNTIFTVGPQAFISIQATHPRGIRNTRVMASCPSFGKKLIISKGCSIESAQFSLVNENNISVEIGEDCMMSSEIVIRSSDGHAIYDMASNEITNHAKPIIIGKHVWIGARTTIIKGGGCADNTIIGTGSLVTRTFDQSNIAIAGVPARILRRNVNWDRRRIHELENARMNGLA